MTPNSRPNSRPAGPIIIFGRLVGSDGPCMHFLYCSGHCVLPTYTEAGGAGTAAGDASMLLAWSKGMAPLSSETAALALACLPSFPGWRPSRQSSSAALSRKNIYLYLRDATRVLALGSGIGGFTCCQTKHLRRGVVLDMHVWSECFNVMVVILASTFPDKATHFRLHVHHSPG